MRASVDTVQFAHRSDDGTVVRLEKALIWDEELAVRWFTVADRGNLPRR